MDIRGVERLQTESDSIAPEAACTSVQFHLQVAPDSFANYWNAAQAIAGVQLAIGANSPFLYRPAALGGDPDRAVRAGHRHPAGRDEDSGRTATGVVRRALDHVDLRPVRGERPLLPGAAADLRHEDPVEVLTAGGVPRPRRTAPAQRHRLPVEPPGLRHHGRPAAPARGKPRAAGRPDRRRPARQRAPSTSGWSARWSRRTVRSGRRSHSARPRRTSTSVPATASRRAVYWPRLGEMAATNSCWSTCCRRRTQGWTVSAWPRPAATGCSASSRAAAGPGATARTWQVETVRRLEAAGRSQAGGATRDASPLRRPVAVQRTRAHLVVRLASDDLASATAFVVRVAATRPARAWIGGTA